MHPSKILEAVAAFFIPSSCREEVLGDLHERYQSPSQYIRDALRVVPLVVLSRLRRNSDRQVVLIQGLSLYLCFLAAAWFADAAFFNEKWSLLRLAIPAAVTLFGLLLDDAYADRDRSVAQAVVRGPAIGVALSIVLQGLLWAAKSDLATSRWTMLYGCAASLIISSTVRGLLPAPTQLQSANGSSSLVPCGGVQSRVIVVAILWIVVVGCQLWIRG